MGIMKGIVTDRLIKKFAAEHGKAAAIKKFGKERVAEVKISTKKIGTPPSRRGYGGGQGEDMIPSQPMTGKPSLMTKDKYPSDISGVSPHVPKGRRGMRKGGKITSKKDPYAEGTGIPSGQKGTPPPSIFKQKKKKIKKKGGGMTGEGLYPAEEARSGTMSQAKRKKYMKKGGKITYRMTGGQVVAAGYDK